MVSFWRKLLQFLSKKMRTERRKPEGVELRKQITAGEKEAVKMKIEETQGVNRNTSQRLKALEIQKDILKRQ